MTMPDKHKYVLLVEDNPDDRMLTVRALRKHHLANDIVEVIDGQQALDFLFGAGEFAGRDPKHVPQVVLLDLQLPKVDGLEVLQQMRANPTTKHVPVVVLTSSAEQKDLVDSYEFGANSYVRKPVDFDEFLEAARQLGMYWLLLNQTPRQP